MKPILNEDKLEKLQTIYKQLYDVEVDLTRFWLKNTFLKWDFWIGVILTIVPWLIWIKYHKKESRYRLLFSGLFVMIISSYLDFWGVITGRWMYSGRVVPSLPSFAPWDTSLLPVFTMFLIQIKPKVNSMKKAIIFGFISAFIGESVFKLIGMYKEISWNSFYSFPIYMIIYLIASWLSKRKNFEELK